MADENKISAETQADETTDSKGTLLTNPPPSGEDENSRNGADPAAGGEAKAQEPSQSIEIKLPDGVKVDENLLAAVKAAAKDSESAQALVNAWLDAMEAAKKKFEAALQEKEKRWIEELRADPVYGGAKYAETIANAQRAFQRFGGDELREYLETTREGNNPVLIKTFANIGRALREDSIAGTTDQGAEMSDDQKALRELFPKMAEQLEQEGRI